MNTELEGLLCDSEAARLLPWHVTGRLAADEDERVAQHIEHCAICRQDLADQRALRTRVRAEATVEIAPQAGLAATLARIDELGRELGRAGDEASPTDAAVRPANAVRRPLRMTQWLAAAVVVQAIGLALVGRALLTHQDARVSGGYQTLSSAEPAAPAAAIRAVFARSMTTDALRALLRAQHLGIVAGPSESGVFTLGLKAGGASPEAALQALRADPRVEFAEPAAAGGAARP